MSAPPKPVVLCILDGWGIGPTEADNAPKLAHTPTFRPDPRPRATCDARNPWSGCRAADRSDGEFGSWAHEYRRRPYRCDGSGPDRPGDRGWQLFQNPAILAFADKLKDCGGTAHLMGVVSDGGVHGHLDHTLAAARMLDDLGVPVVIHAITDGRDVPPRSAGPFIDRLSRDLPRGGADRHRDRTLLRHGS
jgi:2,3-bisphosphoglycerate-independent phosphoglycerate mutase